MYNNSIYLTKEQILDDLKRFCNRMIMTYNIDHASPYFNNIEDGAEFGYDIQKDGTTIIIKKPYLSNENGDYTENTFRKEWTTEIEGKPSNKLYMTLGDVYEALDIQRTK